MPFPDEVTRLVVIVDYKSIWPHEFELLRQRLRAVFRDLAIVTDHIGSTAVPGLAAKDCIDAQVQTPSIDDPVVARSFIAIGFRLRPEIWNRVETSEGRECRKLVFAPPMGERACNVHVRPFNSPNSRYALLFRDYLRSNERARQQWGSFKQRLALSAPHLYDYGQIKSFAFEILMTNAERWAIDVGWQGVVPRMKPAPPN